MSAPSAPDLAAIKARQQQAWAAGDYSAVGTIFMVVSENLCEAADLHPGWRVLDVATGSGNTAIAAARRFCEVTGVDYVPALLERGRERAAAERLPVTFLEGDAEALPFPDASFDAVLSTFGVMLAPDYARAATELLRVCRPGGTIALANWTPEGWAGQLGRTIAQHVPPPPGLAPPPLWGTEGHLRELFGEGIAALRATRRDFIQRYRSPAHWLELSRRYVGPIEWTFAAVGPGGEEALARDLLATIERFNRADDGTAIFPSEYLEVVATRR